MTASGTLVLAGSQSAGQSAAPLVTGDATLVIGQPAPSGATRAFATAAIAPSSSDKPWLADAFTRADAELTAGGRVLLVLPASPFADDLATETFLDLPEAVLERWRVVGLVVERPAAAVVLVRAADDDGTRDTAVDLRRAELAILVSRRPDLARALDLSGIPPVDIERPQPVEPMFEAVSDWVQRARTALRPTRLGRAWGTAKSWARRLGRSRRTARQ